MEPLGDLGLRQAKLPAQRLGRRDAPRALEPSFGSWLRRVRVGPGGNVAHRSEASEIA
jgi:hypothetical protein